MYRRAMQCYACVFLLIQLAMKSHEHIIVNHCLVRKHARWFRFVRKMIKHVAVADPSLIITDFMFHENVNGSIMFNHITIYNQFQ